MKRIFLLLGLLAVVVLCGCEQTAEEESSKLPVLADWMTGSFSSREQAEADSSYFDIRLEMARIWPNDTDGYWLYVEQAVASLRDEPYRQRVYHVYEENDSTFKSEVYEFDEPLRFVGVWRQPTKFILPKDSLKVRSGCVIVLHPEGDSAFVGSTVEKNCESSLRGAAYATSEVRITKDQLVSWDRGFDADDNQVWGAEDGGYVFNKITTTVTDTIQ